MIPKDVLGANMDYVNLITIHCEINLNMKKNENYIGKESRATQDTNMMYHCLMNPLSNFGKSKVFV